MADRKLIDKELDDYTQDGARCYREAVAALRFIKQDFIRQGFKAKEINEIFKDIGDSAHSI
jgi:hypothetical protein